MPRNKTRGTSPTGLDIRCLPNRGQVQRKNLVEPPAHPSWFENRADFAAVYKVLYVFIVFQL